MMIPFTVFDASSRVVLSHKWASHADQVSPMIPAGAFALIGRHVPYDELVPDGVEFVIPADPDTPDYTHLGVVLESVPRIEPESSE